MNFTRGHQTTNDSAGTLPLKNVAGVQRVMINNESLQTMRPIGSRCNSGAIKKGHRKGFASRSLSGLSDEMNTKEKQNIVRQLDLAKHKAQLLEHKKNRLLLQLIEIVKDKQLVEDEFTPDLNHLIWRYNDPNLPKGA